MLGLRFQFPHLHLKLFCALHGLDQLSLLGGLGLFKLCLGCLQEFLQAFDLVLEALALLLEPDLKLVLLVPLLALLGLDLLNQQVD